MSPGLVTRTPGETRQRSAAALVRLDPSALLARGFGHIVFDTSGAFERALVFFKDVAGVPVAGIVGAAGREAECQAPSGQKS